jgi:hypothetical protein
VEDLSGNLSIYRDDVYAKEEKRGGKGGKKGEFRVFNTFCYHLRNLSLARECDWWFTKKKTDLLEWLEAQSLTAQRHGKDNELASLNPKVDASARSNHKSDASARSNCKVVVSICIQLGR